MHQHMQVQTVSLTTTFSSHQVTGRHTSVLANTLHELLELTVTRFDVTTIGKRKEPSPFVNLTLDTSTLNPIRGSQTQASLAFAAFGGTEHRKLRISAERQHRHGVT